MTPEEYKREISPLTQYRKPTASDYKKGTKYKAFIGYRWIDVEVGKDGFDPLDNFLRAAESGLTKIKIDT